MGTCPLINIHCVPAQHPFHPLRFKGRQEPYLSYAQHISQGLQGFSVYSELAALSLASRQWSNRLPGYVKIYDDLTVILLCDGEKEPPHLEWNWRIGESPYFEFKSLLLPF